MRLFKKNQRKEYLKLIGRSNFGKEELKEIKQISKEISLEEFKICVTPILNESKLKELEYEYDIKKMEAGLHYLNSKEIKEIRLGFENNLTVEEVEMYKKLHLDSNDMENIRNYIIEAKIREYDFKELDFKTDVYRGNELKSYIELERNINKYKKMNKEYVIEKTNILENIIKTLPSKELNKIILSEKLTNETRIKNPEIIEKLIEYGSKVRKEDDEFYINEPVSEYFNEIPKEEALRKDSDGDGLTDYEEKYLYITDPYSRDTDGDGRDDRQELNEGRNPNKSDKKIEKSEEKEHRKEKSEKKVLIR